MINMKKILFALMLFILTFSVKAQVTEAVDQRAKIVVEKEVPSLINKAIGEIEFDTLYIRYVSKTGNIDTLTTPGIYQLSVTGTASAVRILYVSRNANGNYSIRTSNPLAWAGAGTWTIAIINNRVVVSTTAINLTYQRQKLQ